MGTRAEGAHARNRAEDEALCAAKSGEGGI
jgi:hypothetical protein